MGSLLGTERATPEWWREEPMVQRNVESEEGYVEVSDFFFYLFLPCAL